MIRVLRAFCLAALALGASAGVAAAAGEVLVPDRVDPVVREAEPVTELEPGAKDVQQKVERVAEPAGEPVANVSREVEAVAREAAGKLRPVVKPVVEKLDPVVEPVTELAKPVVEPVTELAKPVTDVIAPAVEPIADVIDPVVEVVAPPDVVALPDLVAPPDPLTPIGALPVDPQSAVDPARPITPPVVDPPFIVDRAPAPGGPTTDTSPRSPSLADTAASGPEPGQLASDAHISVSQLIPWSAPGPANSGLAGAGLAMAGVLWIALFGLGLLPPILRAGRRLWASALLPQGLVPLPAVPPG